MSNMAASGSSGTVLFQRGRVSKTNKEKKNVFKVIEKCFSKHVWKTLLILKVLHVYDHFAQIQDLGLYTNY